MDQIVAQALTVYGKIEEMKRKEAAVFAATATGKNSIPLSVVQPKTNGNGKAATNF
jgi:hypothetical protein